MSKVSYYTEEGLKKLRSDLNKLKKLNYLIIDCLKFKRHPGHFNLETSIRISAFLKPKKTILTNLHTELDYNFLKKIKTPRCANCKFKFSTVYFFLIWKVLLQR